MTEKEYRALEPDSYSSFKDFSEDRKKYYRKHILKEKVAEKEDLAIRMGGVVDVIALSPDEFDTKFYLTSSEKIPTGNMKEFTENLYKISQEDPEKLFEQKLKDAYAATKYDQDGNMVAFKRSNVDSFESVVVKFEKECRTYFDEISSVRPNGLIVISHQDLQNAEKIKDELFTSPFTSKQMKWKTVEGKMEVDHQVPVFCEINDYSVKGLLDKRVVNHEEKWIQPFDLKVTWNVDEFLEKYYLYRRSDWQAAIYYLGLLDWRDKNYPNYEVRPMSFIVADSINYMSPLIYETSEKDVADALGGFTYKNKEYPGLMSIIDDLKWAKENDIWHISRENFMNNGVVKIKI